MNSIVLKPAGHKVRKKAWMFDRQGNLNLEAAIYLMLSMTRRCNMRCPGCYYLQQEEEFFKNRDINLEAAKEIVSYYHNCGVQQAVPNAEGDVLLHQDYLELLEFIRGLGFKRKPWLVTNGLRLPMLAERIVHYAGEILISVDGSTHEKYTAYRGGNRALFEKVMKGIKSVVAAAGNCESKPTLIINCVMTANRVNDIPDMISLAEELGVDHIKFTNYHVAGDSDGMEPLLHSDSHALQVLNQVVNRTDYRVSISLPSLYGKIKPPYFCKMLASVMIGSNGDYSPCCRIVPDAKWGNYYTSTEKHNNPALRQFRLSVLQAAGHDQLPQICRQCAHLSPRRAYFNSDKKAWFISHNS